MAKYKVKPGLSHGPRGEHKGGAIVELTDQEYAAFGDKFDRVDESTLVVAPAEAGAPFAETALDGLLSDGVVQLLRLAGYATAEAVRTATHAQLMAIDGMTPRTYRYIRDTLK